MAGCYDSEQQRIIDRIKCVAYRRDRGEVWDGAYFRDQILIGHVIPFLLDPNNVLTPGSCLCP